jgi:hypothetical protein
MLYIRDYPIPDNEASRLAEVRRHTTCDENLQRVFDTTTLLSNNIFQTQISTISFIENDVQEMKAASGLTPMNVDRTDSFCSHAILSTDVMVVLNAAEDIRFSKNRYVLAEPHIRFYAGAPLKTSSGLNIGALCIADSSPRLQFNNLSKVQLSLLARLISSQLDKLISNPGERSEARQVVKLEGMISSYGKKPQPIAVHNISSRGAMIHSPELTLPRGEEVVVSIGTTAIVATVMWARDGLNGLSFNRAIDDQSLLKIQKVRIKATGYLATISNSEK